MKSIDTADRPPRSETRLFSVVNSLRTMAKEKGPHAKLPPVRELCRILGTSINTLDDAMAVLESQDILYRRRGSGVYVSPHIQRRTIAVLLDSTYFETPGISPFWSMLWGLCSAEARRRSSERDEAYEFRIVHPVQHRSDRTFDEVIESLRAERLHGVIAFGLPISARSESDWEALRTLPLVAYAGPAYWMVGVTTEHLAPTAIADLQARGCRRIGQWETVDFGRAVPEAGESVDVSLRSLWTEKKKAHRAVWEQAGAEYREDQVIDGFTFEDHYRSDPSSYDALCAMTHQDQGYWAVERVFTRPRSEWPEGLVIMDDMMTLGALTAFQKLEITPGKDVHLCSLSNAGSIVLHRREDQMARLETDPVALIRALYACLDLLMSGQEPPQRWTELPGRYLPCEG